MNAKYFAILTTIVLATGLSQSVTPAQVSQLVSTSIFNEVIVQRSPKSSCLQIELVAPPPPDRGAPGGRSGGASRAAPRLVKPPEVAPYFAG